MNTIDPLPSGSASVEQVLARGRQRWRQQRLVGTIGQALWAAAAMILVFALALLIFPKAALTFPWLLAALAVLGLVALVIGWVRPVPEKAVWQKVDACGGLHDGVLTLQELAMPPVAAPAWTAAQRGLTSARIDWEKIRRSWPVRFTAASARVAVCCAAALIALQIAYATYTPPAEEVLAARSLSDQAKALEEIRKDWEEALKEQKDNETLPRALAELKPLQDRLAKGELSEKELMVELSKLEDKLTAMQAEQKAEAMSPAMASEMAQALDEMQGASGLAAALQRHDLSAAEKQAADTAAKWEKEGAKALDKPLSEGAQQQLAALASKADGQKMSATASGLRQLGQAGQKNDQPKMAQAMSQLAQGLKQQSNCQSKSMCLSKQMKQISMCKSCMSNCQNPSMCLSLNPSMSLCRKPGGGAGSATNPNVLGAPTDLAANLKQETVQGTMGAGDSEITTEQTTTPTPSQVASGTTSNFEAYEKLSKVAIEDENLPLAHREAIKRYFESIRPKDAR